MKISYMDSLKLKTPSATRFWKTDFAHESVLEEPWRLGSYNLLYNTGRVYNTFLCPSTTLSHINTEWLWTSANVFNWGKSEHEDATLERAYNEEYSDDRGAPGGEAITFGDSRT